MRYNTGDRYKNRENKSAEPQKILRRSQRLRFAKQTEKLGGVPYYTENNKKKSNNHCVLRKDRATNRQQTMMKNQSTETCGRY